MAPPCHVSLSSLFRENNTNSHLTIFLPSPVVTVSRAMATSLRALPRGDGAARVVCARRGRRVVGNGRTSLRSRGFAGSGTAVLGRGNGARVFCAGWVDNKASVVVHGVPLAVVWELWQDKSRIPNWMPWIDSVVPDDKDAQCSRWILRTTQFGQVSISHFHIPKTDCPYKTDISFFTIRISSFPGSPGICPRFGASKSRGNPRRAYRTKAG